MSLFRDGAAVLPMAVHPGTMRQREETCGTGYGIL